MTGDEGSADFPITAYDYPLPPELVAQEPLAARDASRLLVLGRATGALEHRAFADLPELLRPGDLLVTNRSRVFPARLLGRRPGGGEAEVLLVRRLEPDVWEAMVRPGRRLRPGVVVDVAPGLSVRIEDPEAGPLSTGHPTSSPAPRPSSPRRPRRRDGPRAARPRAPAALHPPHGRALRPGSLPDRLRPRGGLRGRPDRRPALHARALLERLRERGIERAEIVLHVGPGTFRPVEANDVREHRVDPERFAVPEATAAAVARARAEGRRVVAVGTTATRALESALDPEGRLGAGEGETALVIVPGFRFRAVDALVTNFHLPRSSLLLLVSAFGGRERVLGAYAEAVRQRYRFYSYGDAMLLG